MQLDLFRDAQDVVLRNACVDALADGDAGAATAALHRLRAAFPDDVQLADLQRLVDAVAAVQQHARQPFRDRDEVARARDELVLLADSAARVDPRGAARLMAGPWRGAAERARALAFDPRRPEDCSVPFWLRGGAFDRAEAAIEAIPSWRRMPVTLGWMVEARHRVAGLDRTWPLLAELACMDPARAACTIASLDDALLGRLVRAFERDFDGDGTPADLAWWPAWLLVERPALQECMAAAQPAGDAPPVRAMQLMLGLLVLERAGRHADLVAQRARLRALHPGLFATYLRTRE
jgi:hypothetical protein